MKTAEIAKYIKDKRLSINMSQSELAYKANCGRLAIIRIENNISTPNVDLLVRVLNALEVDLMIVSR